MIFPGAAAGLRRRVFRDESLPPARGSMVATVLALVSVIAFVGMAPDSAGASPYSATTGNSAPNVPSSLLSDGKTCGVGADRPYVLTLTPVLAARQSDPDAGQQNLATWFHWWPLGSERNDTDKVSQSSANPSAVARAIPAGAMVDGGTYVWQARTTDGSLFGEWSEPCEFTVDITPPPIPGAVSSEEYRDDGRSHGGPGIAGTFDISPPMERADEVLAYAWTTDGGIGPGSASTVPARPTDHGATLTFAPTSDGSHLLRIWSKDRAGRASMEPVTYRFTVRLGGPVAFWKFDEPIGDALDLAQHGNTLTLVGGTTRTIGRGGEGKALSLDGGTAYATTTGPVLAPHPFTDEPTPLRTDASFTVAARARLAAIGGGFQTVVAAEGERASAFHLSYDGVGNRWVFGMAETDSDGSAEVRVVSDGTATAGTWTYLVGVFDATTRQLRLDVNGVTQSATPSLPGGFNAAGPVAIGQRRWNGLARDNFTGAVDDVQLHATAKAAGEFTGFAAPLAPSITFPDGTTALEGTQLRVVFDAKGDINVAKFRYGLSFGSLTSEVVAMPPGGTATAYLDVGNVAGERPVYFAAVDDGNRQSPPSQATFTVTVIPAVSGIVYNAWTFDQLPGATVTLEPGGHETTTDSTGQYSFVGVAPGDYILAATYDGASTSMPVTIYGREWQDIYLFPAMEGVSRLGRARGDGPGASAADRATAHGFTVS